MKQIFKPVSILLLLFSAWITWVCAGLLTFPDDGNLITHSYSVWGDWSAHFTFINALRERGFSWLAGDNPLFPGTPFQYPFLSHVLTYLVSRVTFLDTIHATYWTSVILLFSLPFLLFRTFRKLGLSDWGSLASVMAYLGIGGFQFLDSSLKASEPLTNQFNHGSVFTQFILFEFFPQRAFLFGLVFFLSAVLFTFKTRLWNLKHKIILGSLFSLTALLHIHTWIAMSTLLLISFWLPPKKEAALRKNIFFFGSGVLIASAACLGFLLFRRDASATRLHWNIWFPGWAQNSAAGLPTAADMNFASFWLYNTAFYLPLAFLGIWIKRREKSLQAIAASGAFLFLLAELFNIQPYFYDNLKLFTYAFLFFSPFVGFALEAIARYAHFPKKAGLSLAGILLLIQVTSAFFDFVSLQNNLQTTQFFSKSEFSLAERFKSLRRSPEDIVLINPRHNHWIPCLTGNPVAMGYPGWLWTWGINFTEREKLIRAVLWGEPAADSIIQSLHLQYAAIQNNDTVADRPVNHLYFENHFKKLMSAANWTIYSLNERITSPSSSVR